MNKIFIKAISAGLAIGLGCWIFLTVENPVLGALLFSCGLLAVRIYKLNLFTGKTQLLFTSHISNKEYWIIFLGNIIGIGIMSVLGGQILTSRAIEIATIKTAQPFWIGVSKGIGCGMLMSLATYKESPLWLSALCVLAFISAGFNHCIADLYYFLCGGSAASIIKWIGTILGNIIGGLLFSKYTSLMKDEQ